MSLFDNKTEGKNYLLFSLLFIGASFLILQPFLFGMLWGGVTALAAWPSFSKLSQSGKRRGLLAFAFALAFALLFITPLVFAGYEMAQAYTAGSSYLASNTVKGVIAAPAFIDYLPMQDKVHAFWNDNVAHSGGVVAVLNHVSHGKLVSLFSTLWSELMSKVIAVAVMLVSFYFMLSNGHVVQERYKKVFTYWTGAKSVSYIDSGLQALRGTINGVVLVGIVEGLLLSVPLVMGGLPSGFLIAVVAGILGVIPMLMPALILPCLGYMYLSGNTTWAIIGAVDLALVWFVFENAIKPNMISHQVKVNTFLILVAMIGGMQLMGLVGLFLGPAIIAMAVGMLKDLTVVPDSNESR